MIKMGTEVRRSLLVAKCRLGQQIFEYSMCPQSPGVARMLGKQHCGPRWARGFPNIVFCRDYAFSCLITHPLILRITF